MHDPELLVLDEPTQGLDPLVQHVVHGIVREHAAAGGTVFLSSHILPEVERICDRVGVIGEGRLLAIEDVGQLRAKAVRTVELHLAAPADPAAFAGLSGVSHVEVRGDIVRCTVLGSMDALVKAAARFEVVDLQSQQPGLEELFLHYYRQEDDG